MLIYHRSDQHTLSHTAPAVINYKQTEMESDILKHSKGWLTVLYRTDDEREETKKMNKSGKEIT